MPFTFNGFGTRYAGRANETVVDDVCEFCGKQARISSYDTRLWICALYIPVIPLARKRVLDDCSRCRRHRAMPLERYRELEDQTVREGESGYRAADGDAEQAIAYLARLEAFHRREEAMALAEELAQHFPDDPSVLISIAPLYLAAGRDEEADRMYERAYRADPSHPHLRATLAWRHLAAGRVEDARSLIDAPGAGVPDPQLVLALAFAYQERGEHLTALTRFRELLAQQPQLGQDPQVRRAVAAAEKEVGTPESILPRRVRPVGKIAAVAAGVAALAAIAVGFHHYTGTHRELHVVSAVPGAIAVTVDGGERLELAGPGRGTLTVAEGAHRARVEGALDETVDFTLETGFWEGLAGQPVWVLNPGGLAVVGWEETVYGKPPKGFEPRTRLYAGRSFLTLDEADYAFRDFPEQIRVDSDKGGDTRSRVFDLSGEPAEVVGWLLRWGDAEQALDYLEAWLAVAPADETALAYAGVAAVNGRADEAVETLRPHLATDPINVDWHRAYQNVAEATAGREEALCAEYDRLVAERPDDPVAHYLRARIELEPPRAQERYAVALRLDPGLEYPARGSAYLAMSSGEFERAVAVLRGPAEREGASDEAADLYYDALFAAGRNDELAAILDLERDRPAAEADWDLARRRLLLLVRGGRPSEAEAWLGELQARRDDPDALVMARFLRAHLLYATARFRELRALAERPDFVAAMQPGVAFWAAVEGGEVDAVHRAFERLPEFERRGYYELILSLVHARAGTDGQSRRWLDSALEHLAPTERGYRVFAELIDGDAPATPAALARITVLPREKATLLTLLAIARPEAAELALREADRLNFEPAFPHHFLRGFQPGARVERTAG